MSQRYLEKRYRNNMEEVDSIILHFLRQLNIEIGEDTSSICSLTEEAIIESVSKCITTIDHNLKVPEKLPPGVSQRIEVASHLASICKDLGYKNDVGYQTFLYHNENDLRQVFMFLIEKLPNEDKKVIKTVSSETKHLLLRQISNKIEEDLNSIWIPPCCKSNAKTAKAIFSYEDIVTNSEIADILTRLREVKNPKKTQIEEVNIIEDTKANNDEVSDHIQIESKQTLKELKENTIFLRQKLDLLESERNVMDMEYSQALKNWECSEADLKNIQNILKSLGTTDTESDTMPENLIEETNQQLVILHKKSEELTSRNMSLKLEIEKLKTAKSLNDSERSKCKRILMTLKETAKGIKEECERKEELKNQLRLRYEKLKSGNKRHSYTRRIIEIIGNVDKQNSEIKKILEDTRQLQKRINSLEGQLERCFSIADETLFKDAKKDDQAKKAYKLLALLHSECNTIVSLVNETGTLSRDIVDLEDNIKTEKSKRTEDILQKIKLDLTELQNELSTK